MFSFVAKTLRNHKLKTIKPFVSSIKSDSKLLKLSLCGYTDEIAKNLENSFRNVENAQVVQGDLLNLVAIEWLMMQNPRAKFSTSRPPLPGQDYPGTHHFGRDAGQAAPDVRTGAGKGRRPGRDADQPRAE